MRGVRWRFDRGIRLVGRPAEGEARWIQDALVEQGRLRPVALPDHAATEVVEPGVTCIWKRRNQRRLSVRGRWYGVCAVPGQEILCYTEEGTYPQKEIAGRVYPLGIPQPSFAIQKSPTVYESRYDMTVSTGGQYPYSSTVFYQFMMKGPLGYLPPTDPIKVVFPDAPEGVVSRTSNAFARKPWLFTKSEEDYDLRYEDKYTEDGAKDDGRGVFQVKILLPRPVGFKGYTGCMIFAGATAETVALIYEAKPNESEFIDAGTNNVGKALSSYASGVVKEATYTHAYVFRDGGYESEGAPAAMSEAFDLAKGTVLSFDALMDGYWDQPGLQSYPVALSGPVLGPATMGEAEVRPPASLALQMDDECSFGLNVGLSANLEHPDGLGLATYLNAVPSCSQIASSYRVTTAGVKGNYHANMVTFPELYGKVTSLLNFNKVQSIPGGTLVSWAYDDHFGGIRVNLGRHGLTTGEKIVLYQSLAGLITKSSVVEFMRDVSNPGFGWFVGDTPWDWKTADVIRWARNLLYLPINNTGRTIPLQNLVAPGTFVRLNESSIGTLLAVAFPSANGLFLQGDLEGLAYLGTGVNLLTDPITLEFYDRNAGLRGRRIFRQDSGEFLQVDEIPIWQTKYMDCRPVESLGAAFTGEYIDESGSPILATPPPSDLTNLIQHDNLLAGLSGGVIRLSVPGRHDAWPEAYYFKPDDIPVGLVSFGGAIIVGCRNSISRIDGGPSPATMRITRTQCEDGLLAPRSLQGTPHGLIFLGTQGITITDGHTSRCITDDRVKVWNLFSRRQSDENTGLLSPGTIGAHVFDTRMGKGASWVAAAEDSTTISALAIDGTLGLTRVTGHLDWSSIGSVYHRGRYIIYQRSNLVEEGCGAWMVDLSSNPSQLLHLGFSPIDAWVDGNDLWLLLNGDQ